jgi:serine protease Do
MLTIRRYLMLLGLHWAMAGAVQAATAVDFSDLVAEVSPAVVSVSAKRELSQDEQMQQQIPEVLRRFFANQVIIPQAAQPRQAYGSAFFISSDGYLLTNRHVVLDANNVLIRMSDRRELDAQVVGSDARTDIALLKVQGSGFPALKLGDAERLKVGEPVLAIGSPFGFDYSASAGIVSAKSRTMANESAVPFIQTDAALNPGNSGGPLFNQQGEVVGVNSRIFSGTGGYMGLSFSVPIDVAMQVVEQLKQHGRVVRPFLGVMLQDLDADLAEAYQLPKPEGSLISKITADSPALAAGLKVGDVILAFNQQPLSRTSDLVNLLNRASVGQSIELLVLRNQRRHQISVKLGAAPDSTENRNNTQLTTQKHSSHGLLLRPLTEAEKSRSKLTGLVVQEVLHGSRAERAGIEYFDVISQVNGQTIESLDDFNRALLKAKQTVVALYIIRREQPMMIGLRVAEP